MNIAGILFCDIHEMLCINYKWELLFNANKTTMLQCDPQLEGVL